MKRVSFRKEFKNAHSKVRCKGFINTDDLICMVKYLIKPKQR